MQAQISFRFPVSFAHICSPDPVWIPLRYMRTLCYIRYIMLYIGTYIHTFSIRNTYKGTCKFVPCHSSSGPETMRREKAGFGEVDAKDDEEKKKKDVTARARVLFLSLVRPACYCARIVRRDPETKMRTSRTGLTDCNRDWIH